MPCFQACRSGKGTGYPQGIWLWRPVGFNYRTSTGLLEKDSTLKGDKPNLECTMTQWKGAGTPQDTKADLHAKGGVSCGGGSAGASCGDKGTGSSHPGRRPSAWVPLEAAENQTLHSLIKFLTFVVQEGQKLASELFGFWSFSSNAEAPGGDMTSKYGQGTLWKRELGSNPGQPRTGEQNHTFHSPCSLLPASSCIWLSALIWDFYSFPIIHVCLRSKHFLLILLSQRVSCKLIEMLLEVWNPEIGILFSIQQRKVLTLKALWN